MKLERFPISFWVQPKNTYEAWKEVAEGGYTVAPFSAESVEEGRQVLDWMAELGIQGMVLNSKVNWSMTAKAGWKDVVADITAAYKDHPALWGYFITDEPGLDRFEALGEIVAAFKVADPAHIAYINLFPNYAAADQLGTISYDRHLETYLEIVKPELLSYDNYSLMEDGDRPQYFPNLESIRAAALKADVPFMNIFLATPHFSYRDPSAADMRWQAYTSLAYGAKAIAYFTYVTPDVENYRNGPISIYGIKTPKYDIIRQINLEVQALGKWLVGLKSTSVQHTGCAPAGTEAFCGCGLVAEVGNSNNNLLLGEFADEEGNPWLMVVNKCRERAVWVTLKLRTQLGSLHEVARSTGELRAIARDQGVDAFKRYEDGMTVAFWLAPADGRLMRLSK